MAKSDSESAKTALPCVTLVTADEKLGWRRLTPLVLTEDHRRCQAGVQMESSSANHLVVRAVVSNTSSDPIRVQRIRWAMPTERDARAGLKFSPALDPFYFATENFRGDYYGVGTVRGNSYFNPLPNVTTEHGWSEDQVFPGLFIGAGAQERGLLCAALTQRRCHLIFRLRGPADSGDYFFEIDEIPTGLDSIDIAPGATFLGESLYFGLCPTNDPQFATGQYYQLLEDRGGFARRGKNPLQTQRIWDSWNYDFFANITEADVLKQLPVLKRHFPTVKFVQIDAGYQRRYAADKHAKIDLFYDGGEAFHPVTFPSGGKGLADAIRAAGFRPAIWMGLFAAMESRMIIEHPDWILCDDTGERVQFGAISPDGAVGVLDPSVPGVQQYLDMLGRRMFGEYGFEGVKLDFSSFAFEYKRACFRYPGKTALQWRRWLVETFRKYLPDDGFFGWCVVCGTGNPLLAAEGADYFRCAEDIGEGNWPLAKRIAGWCANTNMLMSRRPLWPNLDSIGWSRHWTETQWLTWLNLAAVTGMAVELGGDLTKLNESQLQRLNTTLELSNPDRHVWCADIPRGPMEHPPAIWVAQGSRELLLGLFNWTDAAARVAVPEKVLRLFQQAGHPVRDAWTRQNVPAVMESSAIDLPAHGSRLLRADG